MYPLRLFQFLALLLAGLSGLTQGVVATIDVNQTGTPITNYHFGQFIENLGNLDVGDLVDDGLWAEMLDDRKFFYPVDTVTLLIPINKRDRMNQWVPVGNAPQPLPKWPIGGEQPGVNAGGDTYPLDIVAALTADRKALTVAVVNPTETEHKLSLDITGTKTSGSVGKWTITGTGVTARNIVVKKAEAVLTKTTLPQRDQLIIEPVSIAVYRYELVN